MMTTVKYQSISTKTDNPNGSVQSSSSLNKTQKSLASDSQTTTKLKELTGTEKEAQAPLTQVLKSTASRRL